MVEMYLHCVLLMSNTCLHLTFGKHCNLLLNALPNDPVNISRRRLGRDQAILAANLKRDNWDEIAVSHQRSAVSKELMADR